MGKQGKRRSPASRRRLAARWLDSGMTAREFAAAHGLSISSLDRWARELRGRQATRGERAGFVEVSSVAPPAASVRLIVGSVTVELDHLPPAEYVAALGRV